MLIDHRSILTGWIRVAHTSCSTIIWQRKGCSWWKV